MSELRKGAYVYLKKGKAIEEFLKAHPEFEGPFESRFIEGDKAIFYLDDNNVKIETAHRYNNRWTFVLSRILSSVSVAKLIKLYAEGWVDIDEEPIKKLYDYKLTEDEKDVIDKMRSAKGFEKEETK